MAAFEGSNNLTCQHIVATMTTCQYQKTEVAGMMAPYVRDPENKEYVLAILDYSFDRNTVSAKFRSWAIMQSGKLRLATCMYRFWMP